MIAEGFATGVSAEVIAGHDEPVYLWMRDGYDDWFAECVEREDELRTRLRGDLDSEDSGVYASWFLGRRNDAGVPARCGYFVAHRWIRELGVPFCELVGWDYEQARSALDADC